MKNIQTKLFYVAFTLAGLLLLNSCEGDLEPEIFSELDPSIFYQSEGDVNAAVTALYRELMPNWQGGYATAEASYRVQASVTTDELLVSWGGGPSGYWGLFSKLNYTADTWSVTTHYENMVPGITKCTFVMSKIEGVKDISEESKNQFIAEIKALRAHLAQLLYGYYGPVPIIVDAETATNPNAKPIARPTSEWMVSQIEKDYTEAATVLPDKFSGSDFGRFTKAVCKMGLLKLYMKEKRWTEAITVGKQIEGMGYSLVSDYKSIFTIDNEQNEEILFAVPCRNDAWPNTNAWLAHVLPGDYISPTGKQNVAWGGYKVPWKTYNKFDSVDKRLEVLLGDYPIAGGLTKRDVLGAIPIKYGEDPDASGWQQGVDLIVWRYADVLLLLAEAINETSGPTAEAMNYVNTVRNRAGVPVYSYTDFDKNSFRDMVLDERLFELYCEGVRRDDLIRHGKYIQRAIDDGFPLFAKDTKILYPLPRRAINESEGLVKQNPGY